MTPTEQLAEKVRRQLHPPELNWFSTTPQDENMMHGSFWRFTPCEIFRHIYELIDEPTVNKDEIKYLLRVAMSMEKSMVKRITKYEGRGWGRKLYPMTPWWEAGKPGCVMPSRRG
jgi:hypothetical protein